MSGNIAGQDPVKLYIRLGWLFDHISGSMYSFGLASFVVQENISLLHWIAAGSSRKSIWEILNGLKVSSAWWKWQISCAEGVRQGKMDVPEPRGARWRAMEHYTWLEELVSKSNTIQTQEDITQPGKIAGNIRPKLCVFLLWLSVHISGLSSSFGLASCVVQDIISLLHWIATGSSRKSIWERLNRLKVSWAWWNVTDFIPGGR